MQICLTGPPGLSSVQQDRKDQHLVKADLGGQGYVCFPQRDLKLIEQGPGYFDALTNLVRAEAGLTVDRDFDTWNSWRGQPCECQSWRTDYCPVENQINHHNKQLYIKYMISSKTVFWNLTFLNFILNSRTSDLSLHLFLIVPSQGVETMDICMSSDACSFPKAFEMKPIRNLEKCIKHSNIIF